MYYNQKICIYVMLGEKFFISKHGETIITILNVVMRIIINEKIMLVFKKDNQYDIPLKFKQASSIDKISLLFKYVNSFQSFVV